MKKVAIVGGGMSGLAAAWGLAHHPDRFDFRLYEAGERLGGNAVTVDMPQPDGSSVPVDISVTACIPSVYDHVLVLLERFGIELKPSRFNYSVKFQGQNYAHDFDSEIRRQLQPEIDRFQAMLKRLHAFGQLSRARSVTLNFLNPFNYISMRTLLNLGNYSADFRYKVLKPMFVNFLMATNVFDMPAALFARYLEFFDIETATPIQTFDHGTRRIYEHMTAGFEDRISLNRPVRKVYRGPESVVVEDQDGERETFEHVIFAANANQTLMMLDRPSLMERYLLSSVRYESELHNHAVVHSDTSVLPEDELAALTTRSNYIAQYGARPDNYEITYIIHNQLPWMKEAERPCLVTYNAISPIDDSEVVARRWFQHIVHDVRHVTMLVPMFRFIQGRRNSWFCGAHTLVNSQETCFVSGLAAARQLGAGYPFDDANCTEVFNYYGGLLHGSRFRKVKRNK